MSSLQFLLTDGMAFLIRMAHTLFSFPKVSIGLLMAYCGAAAVSLLLLLKL